MDEKGLMMSPPLLHRPHDPQKFLVFLHLQLEQYAVSDSSTLGNTKAKEI